MARRRPPLPLAGLVSAHLKPAHVAGLAPAFMGRRRRRSRGRINRQNRRGLPGAAFTRSSPGYRLSEAGCRCGSANGLNQPDRPRVAYHMRLLLRCGLRDVSA
jgi:hypothetical protein